MSKSGGQGEKKKTNKRKRSPRPLIATINAFKRRLKRILLSHGEHNARSMAKANGASGEAELVRLLRDKKVQARLLRNAEAKVARAKREHPKKEVVMVSPKEELSDAEMCKRILFG